MAHRLGPVLLPDLYDQTANVLSEKAARPDQRKPSELLAFRRRSVCVALEVVDQRRTQLGVLVGLFDVRGTSERAVGSIKLRDLLAAGLAVPGSQFRCQLSQVQWRLEHLE